MGISVENKTALVTGANRGIGKAIVESLISAGAAKVYLAVRDINSTAELTEKFGDKVETVFVDVSQLSAIQELAQQTQDVEIVINNAGVLEIATPLSDNFDEAFEKELNVNVYGLQRMAKAFAPTLEKNKGALVQLNSVASIKNFTDFTTYSASKAAAYSVTQGIRELFLPRGIHVLSVHPGPIETDMADKAGFPAEMCFTPQSVSDGIVNALNAGDVHLFPDDMAKDFGAAYASYAENIIEPIQTEEA